MDPFPLASWPLYQSCFRDREIDSIIDDVTIDSRLIQGKQSLFIALPGNHSDGHMYVDDAFKNGARYALVHDSWKRPETVLESRLIRCSNTLYALQDLARHVRMTRGHNKTIVAIGGCTGKTMLKDLLRHIFTEKEEIYISPGSYNSQIGVALSLIQMPEKSSLLFIEMAVNKPSEMEKLIFMAQPTHTIITNFLRERFGIEKVKICLLEQLIELSLKPTSWSLIEKEETLLSKFIDKPDVFFWNILSKEIPKISLLSLSSSETMELFVSSSSQNKEKSIKIHSHHPFVIELIQLAIHTCALLHTTTQVSIDEAITKIDGYTPQTIRTEIWKDRFDTTYINSTYSQETSSLFESLEALSSFIDTQSFRKKARRALIFGTFDQFFLNEKQKRRFIDVVSQLKITDIGFWPSTSSYFDYAYAQHKGIRALSYESAESAIKNIVSEESFDTVIFKGTQKLSLELLFQAIEGSRPQTFLCINLAAIQQNIEEISKQVGANTRIMVMVKALGYGTDDIQLAYFLKKCNIDILGVSYLDEGIKMRKNSVEQAIFIINAMPHEMLKACRWNLEVGIGTILQLEAAQEAVVSFQKEYPHTRLKVHLHVDTGMKRFGCRPEEVLDIAKKIHSSSHLLDFEGFFTHFCSADDPEQDLFTHTQLQIFESLHQELTQSGIVPRHVHVANSAAALRFPDSTRYSMIRVGLAAYGISSSNAVQQALPTLRPALSLVTKIAGLNHAKKNETVGYGQKYRIETENALIGVLPIGYHDGLHRIYSGKAYVLIRGQKAPIIGNICMDYLMVDLSDISNPTIGEPVLIFGEDEYGNRLNIEEFAMRGGSIAHELMTCLGARIQRLFIYDESLKTR